MLSLKDIQDGIKGDIQEKSRNPFFGAFVATWIIRNWEIVFIIFNFDSGFNLNKKLELIRTYLESRPNGDFWFTIVLTFGVIFLGYIFLNLSRFISNIFEKIITPNIYKWTVGKSSIVLKEDYDKVLEREVNWINKFKEEKNRNIQLEEQIQSLEKLSSQDVIEQPLFNEEKFIDEDILTETHQVYQWLSNSELIDDFKDISSQIKNSYKSFNQLQDNILYFFRKGLIKKTKEDKDKKDYFYYELTSLGKKVLEKIYFEDENTI